MDSQVNELQKQLEQLLESAGLQIFDRGTKAWVKSRDKRGLVLWIGTDEERRILFQIHVIVEEGGMLGDIGLSAINALSVPGFDLVHPMTVNYSELPIGSDVISDFLVFNVSSDKVFTI